MGNRPLIRHVSRSGCAMIVKNHNTEVKNMGFCDVVVDGVSSFQIEEELAKGNFIFYGDKTGKTDRGNSKYARYQEAKEAYEKKQQNDFLNYFRSMNWDMSKPFQARANDNAWVTFHIMDSRYLRFANGREQESYCYAFYVASDFLENPACSFEDYRRHGRCVIDYGTADMMRQLHSLQEVLKHNERLEGRYRFRILARQVQVNGRSNNDEGENFNGIVEMLDMISNKYF